MFCASGKIIKAEESRTEQSRIFNECDLAFAVLV